MKRFDPFNSYRDLGLLTGVMIGWNLTWAVLLVATGPVAVGCVNIVLAVTWLVVYERIGVARR